MQHRDIPDGQRHEPKGISTATDGQVYVANGNGSGSWQDKDFNQYGCLFTLNDSVTIANAFVYSDVTNLTSSTFKNINVNANLGEFQILTAGDYEVCLNATVFVNTNQDTEITFRYLKGGQTSTRVLSATCTENGAKVHIGGKDFIPFAVGEIVSLQITADRSTDIQIQSLDFTVKKVG